MDERFGSRKPAEQLLLRSQVIDEMLARTDWTLGEAVGYMRAELRFTLGELARLSNVPAQVIGGIEQGAPAAGTVEEFGRLLGVLGLKLGVVQQSGRGGAGPSPVGGSAAKTDSFPPPLPEVVAVEALPGYALRITFGSGGVRLFEMSGLLERSSGVLTSLRNKETFRQAFVANRTVRWPGDIDLDPELLYRQSVPESRDTSRRIGVAKGMFEMPDDLSYPRDPEWEAMADVGLEEWPTYSNDTAAWAMDQARALRSREAARLDWDRLADEILDVAKAEERELGKRVSRLMATLASQNRRDEPPSPGQGRLVREQRKLVLLQLSDCPSLKKCVSDPRWLSHCWSDAVVSLGTAGFPVETLPEDNPWDVAQLLDEGLFRFSSESEARAGSIGGDDEDNRK